MLNQPKNKKISAVLAFIFQALAWIFLFLRPKRIREFICGQKKEVQELATGQEDFPRFLKDSKALLKDFFIPCEENGHKPKSLRTKALAGYVLAVVLVKVLVIGFLFFTYPSPAELSAIISANIINLINQSRQEAGLEPLAENKSLIESAKSKGQNMLEHNYFSHDTPDGKKPWQWIDRLEYDYVYAGENLAMDFTSAEVVHEAFLKSPTHRKNILNPKYKEIGIAVINGQLNGHKTILLVEFFGTQRKDLLSLVKAEESVLPVEEKRAESIISEATSTAVVAGEEMPVWQPSAEGVIIVSSANSSVKTVAGTVIEYSNIFFLSFLIFIALSLLLNIFVKVKVQHASVILQSTIVIALIMSIILIKFHFIEQIAPQILIL